jgi:hypothetical protein
MPTRINISVTSDAIYKSLLSSGSVAAGALYVIDAFPALYQRTLADMRGIFSEAELSLILDIHNGTLLTPGIAGQHIGIAVRDSIELDGSDKKWDIDGLSMIGKVEQLPIFSRACLELWAVGYWESGSYGDAKIPWSKALA